MFKKSTEIFKYGGVMWSDLRNLTVEWRKWTAYPLSGHGLCQLHN